MGKEITLPLGLEPADVDIGTLTLISGRTYDVTDIDFSTIRNVIGASTNDLSLMSLHSGINKWAAFRPYPPIVGSLYGYTYDIPTMQLVQHTAVAPYRAGDFAGYNHQAVSSVQSVDEDIIYGNLRYSPASNNVTGSFRFGEIRPQSYLPYYDYMHFVLGESWPANVGEFSNVLASVVLVVSGGQCEFSYNVPMGFNNPTSGITRYVDENSPWTVDKFYTISTWFGEQATVGNIGSAGINHFIWRKTGDISNLYTLILRKWWAYLYRGTGLFDSFNDRDIIVQLTSQAETRSNVTVYLSWTLTNWNSVPVTQGGFGNYINVFWSANSDGSSPVNIITIDEGDVNFNGTGTIQFTVNKSALSQFSGMYIFFNRY